MQSFLAKIPALYRALSSSERFATLRPGEGSVDADPAWLRELTTAPAEAPPIEVPQSVQDYAMAPALQVIAPLIWRGKERLQAHVQELAAAWPQAPFQAATAVDILFESLAPQLVQLLGRVMALELNVARLREELPGNTPEERFHSFFVRTALPPARTALFAEYPVLARRIVERIDAWVQTSAEFLTRLCADWQTLRATLLADTEPGMLCEVSGGGDTHRGGRAVCIARFDGGPQLVYKPRSLAVERHFQELLAWLNERGQQPSLRTLALLDRGDYGWVEFVHAAPCTTAEQLRRFYERQGGYLALLYALDAADFHNENLLAAGEHPVLIDLEALFHPRLATNGKSSSTDLASAVLDDSVLRIGLLPHRLHTGETGRGMDISGLGGAAGQLTPFTVPYWERRGTDEVHLARKHVEVPVAHNQPTLAGVTVDVLAYTDAILAGFTHTYELLLAHREALLCAAGPLARFADVEIRVIVRPTARYDELLTLGNHPDVLRDALARDRHFDHLRLGCEQLPQLGRLFASEHADLRAGDIPLFTTRPGSCDVWTAHGTCIARFLAEPSRAQVDRRLNRLSARDLALQVRFIRGSLATLRVGRDLPPSALPATPKAAMPVEQALRKLPAAALSARLLTAAQRIGDELADSAIGDAHQATWVGMTLLGDRYWSLAPLDVDLYTGLPGVALFLGALASVTGNERYARLAHQALATVTTSLDAQGARLHNIGAFSGWGGILYVLSQLAGLLGAPELLAQAREYARRIPALVERDEGLDLINGSAGCILALLALHRETGDASLLTTAALCGNRLLATARPMDSGIAWHTPMPSARPLCGLSHGASGMALALHALGAATRQQHFRQAATAALDYEASQFSRERANWPDWRVEDAAGSIASAAEADYMVTWCHGAAGIGFARLAMLPWQKDARTRAELQAALLTTQAQGFGRSHSLCHGDAGNLELLAAASRQLGDAALGEQVRGGATALLAEIDARGWRCGVPTGVEAPGLMMGLAGIGYGLLRLARPERVPMVLTLSADPKDAPSTTIQGDCEHAA